MTGLYNFDGAVDLTQELANGMPIYPGDTLPVFTRTSTISKNGVNLSSLTIGSHTGTHVDAPLHFVEGGTPVDRIPVASLIGEALVLDLSTKPFGSGIVPQDLQGANVKEGDILLCYTGCSDRWGDPAMNSNFTYLAPEGAKYLVSKKIRAFGIDFLSVEKFHAPSPDTHRELLRNGVLIIESLNKEIKQFVGKRILFICLPLRFKDGDGAPCRALALPIQ
ncbi:MAG: cyclase family protein [Nitrososphaerales archaeon]